MADLAAPTAASIAAEVAARLGCTARTVSVDKLALGLTPARGQALPDHRRDRRAA